MTFRRYQFRKAETLSNTTVHEWEMATKGGVSAIQIHIEVTNGATSNLNNPIYENIRKIEVVDGSHKMFSLTGVQAQIATLLGTRAEPRSKEREAQNEVQSYDAFIPFGDRLEDTQKFLDLAKYSNPKLVIDFDLTLGNGVAATGWATGTGSIWGVAIIDDALSGGLGYNRWTEVKNWTTAASGDETTKMPIDWPWRKLVIRTYEANVCPDDAVTDVKLDLGGGASVPIEEKSFLAAHGIPQYLGFYPFLEQTCFHLDAATHETGHASIQWASIYSVDPAHLATLSTIGCGQFTIGNRVSSTGGAVATRENLTIGLRPVQPYSAWLYDFERWGLLNVKPHGKAELKLTQANAGGAAAIILEEFAQR